MKSFLTGLGAGFAVALFVAPKRGSETRRQLRSKARRLGDAAAEQASRLKDMAEDPERASSKIRAQTKAYADQAIHAAGDVVDRVKDAAVKDAAQSLASRAGAGALAMLNTASRDELLAVYGIGPVLADKIIRGRPYTSERDAVERNVIAESTVRELNRASKSA